MRKAIYLFSFLLLSSTAFAQVNLKDLKRVGDKFYSADNTPYTGKIAGYYDNGKKQVGGNLINGLADGIGIVYDEDGNIVSEITYKNGKRNGSYKDYYSNGTLKQEVNNVDNKDDGKGVLYYETGEKHAEFNFKNGVRVGDYIEFDKHGKIIRKLEFVDGKVSYGKHINDLVAKALEKARAFKNDEAIALYTQAIAINPTIAELYFNRGATKGNNFDYDGAIPDYDKAIDLNPDYKEAYANRGSAKINHYTSKGNVDPTPEQTQSACEDFYKAKELGDGAAVEDMIYVYCERKGNKPDVNTAPAKEQPLMFLDGEKTGMTALTALNPDSILEVTVIKSPEKTAAYGPGGENGVLLITTNKFGTVGYQKVLGGFSKEYAEAVTQPDVFLYKLNSVLLTGKPSQVIRKLYALKAENLKSVVIDKSGPKPVVIITTKQN